MLKASKEHIETKCPICGHTVTQNSLKISEINVQFLQERSADETLDEALTVLRIIVEKVPGVTIDVANKSALEEYFQKIQEQVSDTVVTPIALLIDNANQLIGRLSALAENVPADIKSEFIEVNKDLAEKLKNIEKNATEIPLTLFSGALNPLTEKLGHLIENLPKDVKEEFKEVRADLQEKLVEIKNSAEKSNNAVGDEVEELRNTINSLINKPTNRGRFGEGVLAESWTAECEQDIVDQKGGAGEPDALVVPYLGMNGGSYGQKISVERKTGAQKYSGKHLEEASRHARKCGATQVMLVYDSMSNLPEELRPMKVMFRPQQRLTIAIASLGERTWVTAREILEVLQIIDPRNGEPKREINMVELDNAVSDIQAINITIDKLRKTDNTMNRCCDEMRTRIEELELLISSYQSRLRQVLDEGNARKN